MLPLPSPPPQVGLAAAATAEGARGAAEEVPAQDRDAGLQGQEEGREADQLSAQARRQCVVYIIYYIQLSQHDNELYMYTVYIHAIDNLSLFSAVEMVEVMDTVAVSAFGQPLPLLPQR